jgi:hypothetical protein
MTIAKMEQSVLVAISDFTASAISFLVSSIGLAGGGQENKTKHANRESREYRFMIILF